MLENFVKKYYHICDVCLGSGTAIVLIITMLVFTVGLISPAHADQGEDALNLSAAPQSNFVVIDGVEYEMFFRKVR